MFTCPAAFSTVGQGQPSVSWDKTSWEFITIEGQIFIVKMLETLERLKNWHLDTYLSPNRSGCWRFSRWQTLSIQSLKMLSLNYLLSVISEIRNPIWDKYKCNKMTFRLIQQRACTQEFKNYLLPTISEIQYSNWDKYESKNTTFRLTQHNTNTNWYKYKYKMIQTQI